jgi:multisubunit Na+/H+ antiporter MnhF subunit
MATIALLLGVLSFIGSILFFLGELSSPAEWGVLVFGLGALVLGFGERGSVSGKMAMALALLALLPSVALFGWLRWTVMG